VISKELDIRDQGGILSKDAVQMRKRKRAILFILPALLTFACATGKQPDAGTVKKNIENLGLMQLEKEQLKIVNVAPPSAGQVIVDVDLRLAMKLSKSPKNEWQIDAARLGDRDWLEMKTLVAALIEVRIKETQANMQKLVEGLRRYRQKNSAYPPVKSIVKLTDLLAPEFMAEIIRYDSWNRELIYAVIKDGSCQLLSLGADGEQGTKDDILFTLANTSDK
jgi:hypothetical protein